MVSPFRQLGAVVMALLVAEVCIMLALPLLPGLSVAAAALIDSFVLIAIVSPTLYLMAYRPMCRQIALREEAERQLVVRQDQLRALASELIGAAEAARRQFGTGLSESVGQLLATARIRLDMMETAADSAALEEIRATLDEAMGEIARLTYDLSHPELYEIGLGAAVERLAERMGERSGRAIRVEGRCGGHRLPVEARVAAYHVLRELLDNVLEHAGAHNTTVKIGLVAGQLRLEVADDGVGFDPGELATGEGLGLFEVGERLRLVGGAFEIDSAPGTGTIVTAVIPVEAGLPEAEGLP